MGFSSSLRPQWRGRNQSKAFESTVLTGQETDQLCFQGDSISIRIENLDANIVGAIQFYNLPIYEMALAENDVLSPDQEIGRRYTPGELPLLGEKRRV